MTQSGAGARQNNTSSSAASEVEALRRDRDRLRQLLDHVPETIYFKDADGRFTLVNRALATFFGTRDPAEVVGRTDADFFPAEDAARYRADEVEIAETGVGIVGKIESCPAADGKRRWFATTKVPVRDEAGEITGLVGLSRDVTERRLLEMLHAGEAEVLRQLATGQPLDAVLGELVRVVEAQVDGMLGSVLLLSPDRARFADGVAPGLPPEYMSALIGLEIGPSVGSCGAAAFLNDRIVTEDVETDPRWAPYLELARPHGLRACWSEPIRGAGGEVLGTFAMYYRTPRAPRDREIELIVTAAHIASIAIEIRRAHRGLQRERDLLQVLMDRLPDAIYFKDVDQRFTRVNTAQARYLGLRSPAEAVGCTDEAFFPPEVAEAYAADDRAVVDSGDPLVGRVEHNGATGDDRRWFSTTKVPMRADDGAVIGLVGVSRDITERIRHESALQAAHHEIESRVRDRTYELTTANEHLVREMQERRIAEDARHESETRFHQLAEHIEEVFWLMDWKTGRAIYVSPAYETIYGRRVERIYENPEDWIDAIHPDDREHVRVCYARIPEVGSFEEIYRIIRPDGKQRWIRDRGFVVAGADGEVARIAGVAEDVTDQKEAEEAKRQHEADLAHVTRLSTMGEMTAGLAHELNQPLAAIMNFAEACLRGLKAGDVETSILAEDLEHVINQAERGAVIIRRLRGFVQKEPPARQLCAVDELVLEMMPLIEPIARKAGVTVERSCAESLPPIRADRIQIQQVVFNVARNGIEAMSDLTDRPRHLAIEVARGQDGFVTMVLRNTGPAIDPIIAAQVFEPFFSTKDTGMGLGLSIARTIIESHAGRLRLEQEPGVGVNFIVELPTGEKPTDA